MQSKSIILQHKIYLPTSFDLLFMTVSDSATLTPAVVGNKKSELCLNLTPPIFSIDHVGV